MRQRSLVCLRTGGKAARREGIQSSAVGAQIKGVRKTQTGKQKEKIEKAETSVKAAKQGNKSNKK